MRVTMYCDAGREIGMGHLMRCLTLAEEAVRQGWQVELVGRLDARASEIAGRLVPTAKVIVAPDEDPVQDLVAVLERSPAEVVHFDSYDERLDRFAEVHEGFVSNMHDGSFGARAAGLAIDANLGAELGVDAFSTAALSLLGIDIALIRDEVRSTRPWAPTSSAIPKLLVVLGGTDPTDSTPRVVARLASLPLAINLTVIAPEQVHARLKTITTSLLGEVTVLDFTDDLPALAVEQDLIITAAGTSVWDFAHLGVPMAAVAVVDNQLDGYRAVVDADLAIGLGSAENLDPDAITTSIGSLLADPETRKRLSNRGRELIDGLGAWRVVSSWRQALACPPSTVPRDGFAVRSATSSDARLLFEWRNDPTTRAVSRSSDELVWADHLAWVARSLASTDRRLLIVERHGMPVATVRWDRVGTRSWEASITVDPTSRGQGVAAAALALTELWLDRDGPLALIATVHRDNQASTRLFARAGYLPHLPPNELGFAQYRKWLPSSRQATASR